MSTLEGERIVFYFSFFSLRHEHVTHSERNLSVLKCKHPGKIKLPFLYRVFSHYYYKNNWNFMFFGLKIKIYVGNAENVFKQVLVHPTRCYTCSISGGRFV